MEKIFSEIKLADLPEYKYIVKVPQSVLEEGYDYLQALFFKIQNSFPNKQFIWIPGDLEFLSYEKNKDQLISLEKKIEEAVAKMEESKSEES